MSVLGTTSTLGLKLFNPGTAWLAFNDNLDILDAWYKTNVIDADPSDRISDAHDQVKKASDYVTADSVYVDVLQAWDANILSYESAIIEDGSLAWTYQMIAEDINFGLKASKTGGIFYTKIPTIASKSSLRDTTKDIDSLPTSLHYNFGQDYISTDLIKALNSTDEYVLAYESASSDYQDASGSPTPVYFDPSTTTVPSGYHGIPGMLWDGFISGGTETVAAAVESDAYSNEFVPGISGINDYLDDTWTTGINVDFMGETGKIRPPGYLDYRTFGQDMYNATLMYRMAVEYHFGTTMPSRYADFRDSVSNDLYYKNDQLDYLVDTRINTDVSNELSDNISELNESISSDLRLDGNFILSGGYYDGYKIDDAIDILSQKVAAHANNEMMVEVKNHDGIIGYASVLVDEGDVNGVHQVRFLDDNIGTVTDSDIIPLGADRVAVGESESMVVPTGWHTLVVINDSYMYIKFEAKNPHYVHGAPANEDDQGIVDGLNITYTSGDSS